MIKCFLFLQPILPLNYENLNLGGGGGGVGGGGC